MASICIFGDIWVRDDLDFPEACLPELFLDLRESLSEGRLLQAPHVPPFLAQCTHPEQLVQAVQPGLPVQPRECSVIVTESGFHKCVNAVPRHTKIIEIKVFMVTRFKRKVQGFYATVRGTDRSHPDCSAELFRLPPYRYGRLPGIYWMY